VAAVEYSARCHCGSLAAIYHTAILPSAWPVRACQCDFCRSHGALSTSDPQGSLAFQAQNTADIQRYRFGGRTTDFLLCRECGVYVGAQIKSEKGRFGILNVATLRPFPSELPITQPMNYSAEAPEEKRSRREARWTPLAPDSI
jgi:hypothetical protein